MREDVAIAVIAPGQPEGFFGLLWQGVWEATFDLASFGVQVLDLTAGANDVTGQRQILTTLLNQKVDAIGILPAHVRALDDLIDEHEGRGTRVVTFFSDAPMSKRSLFVGPDSRAAGRLAAEVLSKLMRGKGEVISFRGRADEHRYAERYEGFRETLAQFTGMHEAFCAVSLDWLELSPEQELADILMCAEGIYVGNEDLDEVASALAEANIKIPCIGFGNTERARAFLMNGTISTVIDESRYQQGYFAVQKAYEAVLKGAEGKPPTGVRIPSTVAFRSNASEVDHSLNNAFEMLVRQRTEVLSAYKARLEEANVELRGLAVTDSLTNLMNRRRFSEVLEQEALRALRYEPVSLLIIDLNRFKAINDRYGHPAGDDALKLVAALLKQCCRATDVCARLGGDEFAVILPCTGGDDAQVVRDRIARRISETALEAAGDRVTLSASIGIATLPGDAKDGRGLIAAADAAMYRVKHASRSQSGAEVSAGL